MAVFAPAAPTLPRLVWQVIDPWDTKLDDFYKKHFDPTFQKGIGNVDSKQSVTDSIQTRNNYNRLLIVEHPLNHSNFCSILIFTHML